MDGAVLHDGWWKGTDKQSCSAATEGVERSCREGCIRQNHDDSLCAVLDGCGDGHSITREAVRLCMVDDTTTMYIDERMVSALSSRRCLQISLWFGFLDRTNQIKFDYAIDSLCSITIRQNRQQHYIKCIMIVHNNGGLSNIVHGSMRRQSILDCVDICPDPAVASQSYKIHNKRHPVLQGGTECHLHYSDSKFQFRALGFVCFMPPSTSCSMSLSL